MVSRQVGWKAFAKDIAMDDDMVEMKAAWRAVYEVAWKECTAAGNLVVDLVAVRADDWVVSQGKL